MSHPARLKAVQSVAKRTPAGLFPARPVKDQDIGFAEDVFTRDVMKEYLPKDTCRKILSTIDNG